MCLSANQTSDIYSKRYIWLLSISKDTGFWAQMDMQGSKGKARRKTITIKPDGTDNLGIRSASKGRIIFRFDRMTLI